MSFDLKIYNGDVALGSNGDLQKVENTDKLIQDILKIATTPLGSNKFHPWYGSPISKSLVGMPYDMEFMSTVATNQLKNSLESLQKLQRAQANEQRVTPSEQLAALQEVKVERNQVDPRFFQIFIRALTNALTVVQTSFNIKEGL